MDSLKRLEELMEVAHGYQRSMALFTGLRLGVFSALASGPSDASRLARTVSADTRRLSILLNALVAVGLLKRDGAQYENGKLAARYLTDGPLSRRSILLHHRNCWAEWTDLERKIRAGRKGAGPEKNWQENFIRGMEDNSRERAAQVAREFPLREGERLLDLGGGPGTYALEWAVRYPGAKVTLFDLPETVRIARRILSEKGRSGEVEIAAGDFLKDPLGGPYDFVWISQILHAFSERECIRILRRARQAMAPKGRVAVQEFLLDEGKTSPPGPAFFSVHMVAATEGGRSYTEGEIKGMLSTAGFRKVSARRPDPAGVGIVTAQAGKKETGRPG